jgi:D-serine deaminase-like pyridoxal phosphate-dependent protein
VNITDLPTPCVLIDRGALERNLAAMATLHPGPRLRPHVKAHKCTALAARQVAAGHVGFTCATPREMVGMAAAGLGADLLLANETIDPDRLRALAALQDDGLVTVAVDSEETIRAAASAGIRHVLVDVNIGLPRCGCRPDAAGHLAHQARGAGLVVRGVMGYEGHLMMVDDPIDQAERFEVSMTRLLAAHADVGGEVVSGGGTGTAALHAARPAGGRLTEVQAGSYALMDTAYARHGQPFEQACSVLGTVISVSARHAVADVGLKALGMDHGNPDIAHAQVHFVSDEHVTFTPDEPVVVGDRVRLVPAHIDPTMAVHDVAWLVDGDEVVDRWAIDLRGW